MKDFVIIFGTIIIISVMISFYIEGGVDILYWMLVISICYISIPLPGFIRGKSFYAGIVGIIDNNVENKTLRLLVFVGSIIIILLLIGTIYLLYFGKG